MTLTEATALERLIQDTSWQWTRTFRAELRSEIETGAPTEAWDNEGVSWFSRAYMAGVA